MIRIKMILSMKMTYCKKKDYTMSLHHHPHLLVVLRVIRMIVVDVRPVMIVPVVGRNKRKDYCPTALRRYHDHQCHRRVGNVVWVMPSDVPPVPIWVNQHSKRDTNIWYWTYRMIYKKSFVRSCKKSTHMKVRLLGILIYNCISPFFPHPVMYQNDVHSSYERVPCC